MGFEESTVETFNGLITNVYEDCHQPRTPLDGDWFT